MDLRGDSNEYSKEWPQRLADSAENVDARVRDQNFRETPTSASPGSLWLNHLGDCRDGAPVPAKPSASVSLSLRVLQSSWLLLWSSVFFPITLPRTSTRRHSCSRDAKQQIVSAMARIHIRILSLPERRICIWCRQHPIVSLSDQSPINSKQASLASRTLKGRPSVTVTSSVLADCVSRRLLLMIRYRNMYLPSW
jgi:hypothetical protein